jgi:hypothetical protein
VVMVRQLRMGLVAAASLLVAAMWAPHCAAEDSFHFTLYPLSNVGASTCASNGTDVKFQTGCQVINAQRVQFDCTEDAQLRVVIGYADAGCTEAAAGGFQENIVSRECSLIEPGSVLAKLLAPLLPKPKDTKSAMGYTAMKDSPCLTDFEEFEQDLGLELLQIFGLNNITNATDPVLCVSELLFVACVAALCRLSWCLRGGRRARQN